MAKRVVVVDDDEVSRDEFVGILAAHPEIEQVLACSHVVASRWQDEWADVDVAVVDATDERCVSDQFPGVAVVERIRRLRGHSIPVIVVTGHYFDDALRWRMREAGADFFYHRTELRRDSALCDAVLHPDMALRGVPAIRDNEAILRHGVGKGTRVNDAVRHANAVDLIEQLEERRDPRSRRWQKARAEFNRRAHLYPVNSDGGLVDRPQNDPSVTQISAFLDWATRVKGRRRR